jgi:DNA-binding PadR family transcriptional regulator
MERIELPNTAWAVLGLLSFGSELTGYDLKKWADKSLRFFFFAPASSQIYLELKRLETQGLVAAREIPQDDLRNKRVFRITPQGERALREWLSQPPVDPVVLKHHVMLRVWLGHLADRDALRNLIEANRHTAAALAAEARSGATRSDEVPEWKYPAMVNRWAARYYEGQVRLADELLAELDADRVQ